MTRLTLRDVFAPYLGEVSCCACPVCLAVADQTYVTNCGTALAYDSVARYAAISEQLRVLASGEHRRVEWDDYVRTLPPAPEDANSRAQVMSGPIGIGLGIGGRMDCRPVEPEQAELAALPVQLNLFEAAA